MIKLIIDPIYIMPNRPTAHLHCIPSEPSKMRFCGARFNLLILLCDAPLQLLLLECPHSAFILHPVVFEVPPIE